MSLDTPEAQHVEHDGLPEREEPADDIALDKLSVKEHEGPFKRK